MIKINLYSDGACSPNPGKGGWGAILQYEDGSTQELSLGYISTTNNRMELLGVINPLNFLVDKRSSLESYEIQIFSDSKYVVDAFNKGWLKKWVENNWRKSDDKPVLNQDLWEKLWGLMSVFNLKFNWVKGHGSNQFNIRCDELAVAARSLNGDLVEDLNYKKEIPKEKTPLFDIFEE